MNDVLPYAGLTPECLAALQTLETSPTFDARAYRILNAEARRRVGPLLMIALPTALAGAGGVSAIQPLGWLPHDAWQAYAFGPLLIVALVLGPLRCNASRDNTRISGALHKWRKAARRNRAFQRG